MGTTIQIISQEFQRRRSAWRSVASKLGWITFGSAVIVAFSATADPSRVLQMVPGGIDPRPVILSSTNSKGTLKVTAGGYQGGPFQMAYCTNLAGGNWINIGPTFTNNVFTVELPRVGDQALFKVTGVPPVYGLPTGGTLSCSQCHSIEGGGATPADANYDLWLETPHAKAFESLKKGDGSNATNTSCLPCHTMGYGRPGGYTIGNKALEGVQCESCHGPAGIWHRPNGNRRPVLERGAMLCGGCHNDLPYRTYDEWKASPHGKVEPEVVRMMNDPVTGPANVLRCGSCHSGAVQSYLASPHSDTPPGADTASKEGAVCVACHDPHRNTPAGHQLLSPLSSTNAYTIPPVTSRDAFKKTYNSQVNLCGQCHNSGGALWTDTERPPHSSPQYNMLVGSMGVFPSGPKAPQVGSHGRLIKDQCVGCHMVRKPVPDDTHPGDSGHGFVLKSFDMCLACHPDPNLIITFTTTAIHEQIRQMKDWLDFWANTKAPDALRSKYGTRSWEYTFPGVISNPPGTTTPGPSLADQALVPDNIKKARHNLYLVQQDGTFGIHNGLFASTLLDAARAWVSLEMSK